MRPFRPFSARVSVLVVGALVASMLSVGCQPKSPEDQVAEARARYVVELQSFFAKVQEPAPVDETITEMVEGAIDQAVDAVEEQVDALVDETVGTDGEVEVDVSEVGIVTTEPGPQMETIFFDLVVFLDGKVALPGLTLEITQLGLDGNEKRTWRRYVELPKMIKAETQQVSFEEEVEFVDGEGFSVNLRSVVPAGERGEYREFAEFAAGG